MSDKLTSSGPIKTFAKIIFVIGVIFTILCTAAIVIAGIAHINDIASSSNRTVFTVLTVVGAVIFFVVSIFLLIVEKALLMSYAEIAEDMRDVRNILARRDTKA